MRFTTQLKTRFASVLIVALCAAFVAPAVAGAQQVSPTEGQYHNTLTQISQGAQPPSGPSQTASASSSGLGGRVGPLPFTGFDVIAMAAVALAVTGLGLGLQRAVSREATDDAV